MPRFRATARGFFCAFVAAAGMPPASLGAARETGRPKWLGPAGTRAAQSAHIPPLRRIGN